MGEIADYIFETFGVSTNFLFAAHQVARLSKFKLRQVRRAIKRLVESGGVVEVENRGKP